MPFNDVPVTDRQLGKIDPQPPGNVEYPLVMKTVIHFCVNPCGIFDKFDNTSTKRLSIAAFIDRKVVHIRCWR